MNQMEQISSSVESLLIQRGVGKEEKTTFNLSNLSSLTTLQVGCRAFGKCHSIVFESDNDE